LEGWQRIIVLIIPYLFIAGIFQVFGGLIAGIDIADFESQKTSYQHLLISIFDLIGTFFVLWIFMKFVDKEHFIKLGFESKGKLKTFVIGIFIGLIIMTLGYLILIYLKEIFFIRINFQFRELLVTIALYSIVAVVEETLFRGYILKNFMNSLNKYIALIISSILFSLMHCINPGINFFSLLDLFLAGIVLGLPYIYTKNLWFSIAMHLSWNLFQTLYGFNVSGLDTYSIIEFRIIDANLINGGAFGFEGSYLSIIAEILTLVGIEIYYKKTNHKYH
jgi:membrane protease YdiL (CAAX protease family)